MTGWRRRLPRYRTREYTSALTGRPVLVQVPTVWGRVARWWRPIPCRDYGKCDAPLSLTYPAADEGCTRWEVRS